MGKQILPNRWFIWTIVFLVVSGAALWGYMQWSLVEMDIENSQYDVVLTVVIHKNPAASSAMGQALSIARGNAECREAGVLSNDIFYNENSKTWWIDLERTPELEKDGCNPACVVWEETKTAEVNWRCTGLIPPTGPEVKCLPEQRNVEACTKIYQPVCALVQIQCVRAPCNPVQETFSNPCNACTNPLVSSYVAGECEGGAL